MCAAVTWNRLIEVVRPAGIDRLIGLLRLITGPPEVAIEK
jgi:hypothetical protein